MDAESGRAARDAAVARMERRIDAMQRPLARAVVEAIRREPVLTFEARARILGVLVNALAPIYGYYPGDSNASLYRAILDEVRTLAEQIEAAS